MEPETLTCSGNKAACAGGTDGARGCFSHSIVWCCTIHSSRSRTDHDGPEEETIYSSTLSLISALHGGGWLTLRPYRFTSGNDPVPTVQITQVHHPSRLAPRPWGQSGRVEKVSPTPGFDPRNVQPVASRYCGCYEWYLPVNERCNETKGHGNSSRIIVRTYSPSQGLRYGSIHQTIYILYLYSLASYF